MLVNFPVFYLDHHHHHHHLGYMTFSVYELRLIIRHSLVKKNSLPLDFDKNIGQDK